VCVKYSLHSKYSWNYDTMVSKWVRFSLCQLIINKYNNMKNRKFNHVTFLEIIAILYGIMIVGGLITVISSVITDGVPNINLV